MRFFIVWMLLTSPVFAGDDWFSSKSSKDSWFSSESKDHYFPSKKTEAVKPTNKVRVNGLNSHYRYTIRNPNYSDRFQFQGRVYRIPSHLRTYKKLEFGVYRK